MSDDSGKREQRRSRRWLQISLRTLFVIVTLAAIGAGAWRWYTEPFRRQRQAMASIEKAGGSYETVDAGPMWLRRLLAEEKLQDVVRVDVADCHEPADYLDHVSALPRLEKLVVRGPVFSDEHLRRLHGLISLRTLVLDCTRISNYGSALRIPVKDWNDLRGQMRYHTRVTTDGIEELRQALPDCEVSGIVLMY
jgi:hypothetical protein